MLFSHRTARPARRSERIEREIASAALAAPWTAQPSPSIRRAIGHRFIEIGARLAAEPSLESARSR